MCHDSKWFTTLNQLQDPVDVVLGDSRELTLCESCTQGKQDRTKFSCSSRRAEEPLGLVHSDLCGKMNEKSLSGTEYFLMIKVAMCWCTL